MNKAYVPEPPSERGAWLAAIALAVLGAFVLAAVLSGLVGSTSTQSLPAAAPPLVAVVTPTPTPGATALALALAGAGTRREIKAGVPVASRRPIVARAPATSPLGAAGAPSLTQTEMHISTRWMEGFYPIYSVAQSTFGVNWLLLASIHRQESAFSTNPTTYHGLNFAGCCGGPMQFNVTNGPITTWDLVSNAYRYGRRPAVYDHATTTHPSIYDDFDAIMAAAWLLSSDGAGMQLDASAWDAAYDYYGHDAAGISYADEVLARAIGWSQHGFCINCGVEPAMLAAVQAAYGAALTQASIAKAR